MERSDLSLKRVAIIAAIMSTALVFMVMTACIAAPVAAVIDIAAYKITKCDFMIGLVGWPITYLLYCVGLAVIFWRYTRR